MTTKGNMIRDKAGNLRLLGEIAPDELLPLLSSAQLEEIAAKFPAYKATAAAEFETSRASALATAVAADPECHGKADVALKFLADESLRELSGEGLVRILKSAAAPTSAASEEAREESQREFMRSLLARNQNSSIQAGSSDPRDAGGAENRGWQKAAAEANARFGL